MTSSHYLLAAILLAHFPITTHAHGRMLIPPSRMSGYLAGLAMPPNYNDHEMNCGGREVQWDDNKGKCGICGEPWPGPKNYERPNGVMVQHQIRTGTFLENEVIRIRLQITVTHKGWHEFRICNVATSGGVEATQACLDRTLLADENGQTRFYNGTTVPGIFDYTLVLPERLTCDLCVIQWKWKCEVHALISENCTEDDMIIYTDGSVIRGLRSAWTFTAQCGGIRITEDSGNDWGCDGNNGPCCVGCGERQEEFYGCSDITINSRNIRYPTARPTTRTTARATTAPPVRTTWSYPSTRTTTTTRRPTTYRTYYTTRPQWTTYRPTTRPPTTRTTTRRPSYPGYNYNIIYDYLKRNPSNINSGTSIKFPGSTNTNYNPPKGRNADDIFIDMVLGRDSVVVTSKDGLSVPVPVVQDSPPTTNDTSTNIENNYLVRDRFCAVCQYSCRFDKCYNYCPEICTANSSHLRSNFGS